MTTAGIAASDRVGRLGVMYFRTLLAQAGIGNNEESPGEDHYATDLTVRLPASPVPVQVKTGTGSPNKDGSFSVSTTEAWRKKWAATKVPVYLVYVHLERVPSPEWIEHGDVCTTLHARAHWTRVNDLSAPTAKVPVENRLTIDTFGTWEQQVYAAFGEAA